MHFILWHLQSNIIYHYANLQTAQFRPLLLHQSFMLQQHQTVTEKADFGGQRKK